MKKSLILMVVLIILACQHGFSQLGLDIQGFGRVSERMGVGTGTLGISATMHVFNDDSFNAMRLQTTSISSNKDMLEIMIPSNAPDNMQFIEMERGSEKVALVNSDGTASFTSSINITPKGTFNVARLDFGAFAGITTGFEGFFLINKSNSGDIFMQTTSEGNHETRMTIKNNGEIGIGTSNPTHLFSVDGAASKPGGGDWSTFSDKRLKKNINPFIDGLEKLLQINPVTFEYNGKADTHTNKEYIGIIAQEIQKIAPYTVEEIEFRDSEKNIAENYLSFDGSALKYITINAIKELNEKVEEKEKAVQYLEKTLTKQKEIVAEQQEQINVLEDKVDQLTALSERLAVLEFNLQSYCLKHQNNIDSSQVIDTGTIDLLNTDQPQLHQNSPNPFYQQTEIKYYLPATVSVAQIQLSDLSGKILDTFHLHENGIGRIRLDSGRLAAGVYAYSLIVEGKVATTKQMILTK